MGNIIDGIWDVCDKFIINEKGQHVSINDDALIRLASDIKENKMPTPLELMPKCFKEDSKDINYKILCYEIIACSINYQFWHGRHDIMHNGACSKEVYKILDDAFYFVEDELCEHYGWSACRNVIKIFSEWISVARFPNTENRVKHIKEVGVLIGDYGLGPIKHLVGEIVKKDLTIDKFLTTIITKLPGYAEDIFLKRAFLLVSMLYRRMGWFKDEIHLLPVPADYHLPKVLEGLGCLSYDYILSEKIQASKIITTGSLEECEIRACTMLACKRLSELSGKSMSEVDEYLWLSSKDVDKPFHLTMTTNY